MTSKRLRKVCVCVCVCLRVCVRTCVRKCACFPVKLSFFYLYHRQLQQFCINTVLYVSLQIYTYSF